jgi:HEPN domain-containing protein
MKKHYDFHTEQAKSMLKQAAEKIETVDQVLMFAQVNAQLATAAMLEQLAHEMTLSRTKR